MAKGLIFLVNDGNYFLSNIDFVTLTASIISRKYSKEPFDAFIYLTLFQVSHWPDSKLDIQVWVPCYINDDDETLSNFINEIGDIFFQVYLPDITGIKPAEHLKENDFDKSMQLLEKLKYIPKHIAYPNKATE